MICSGETIRVLGVCVTAIMTLVAASPQYACACRGGPQSVPSSLSPCGCTCGGGCCALPSDGSEGKCCCCGKHGSERAKPNERSAGHTSCKKTVVPAELFVQSSRGNSVVPDGTAGLWLKRVSNVFNAAAATDRTPLPWRLLHHAPPPDLLALLQHFLI
jgi:hypothetical protein